MPDKYHFAKKYESSLQDFMNALYPSPIYHVFLDG